MAALKKILSREEIRRGEAKERFAAIQREALQEHIRSKEQTLKIDTDVDSTNREQQEGRKLHVSTVIHRLRQINPNLMFEVSKNYPNLMGIYVIENRPDEQGRMTPQLRHVCGMENGMMPEFTVTIPAKEKTRVPDPDFDGHAEQMKSPEDGWLEVAEYDDEVRGWRNVLFRLIQQKLITEAQAEKHFNVSQGRSSGKWKGLLN